ncbi:hypothetical protein Asp14428_73270 [Actinoplanes sp. NBRC 14428]|nr:hypothetical protein Asp14428_73270 [Actinoplanes sp. NBRC 14428]
MSALLPGGTPLSSGLSSGGASPGVSSGVASGASPGASSAVSPGGDFSGDAFSGGGAFLGGGGPSGGGWRGRVAVVGEPGDRRVAMFAAAAVAAGLGTPDVFAWRDVLRGGPVPGPGTIVRIDSPGATGLWGSCPPAPAEPGEIAGLAAAHAALAAALDRIAAGGGTLLNPPADILTMGDKRRCHAVLSAAGVPVPEALPAITGWDGLRAAMRAAGWARVFVKPAYGSSASGVLALTATGTRASAITSVERAPDGRLYNNLRVRRYDSETEIAAIVDRLAADGLHVERWFPKAGLGGRTLDLRVVVIAGHPGHVVVRTSRTPMTNLHLGNARGDVADVRAAAGPGRGRPPWTPAYGWPPASPAACTWAWTSCSPRAGAGTPSPRSTPSATCCPASSPTAATPTARRPTPCGRRCSLRSRSPARRGAARRPARRGAARKLARRGVARRPARRGAAGRRADARPDRQP